MSCYVRRGENSGFRLCCATEKERWDMRTHNRRCLPRKRLALILLLFTGLIFICIYFNIFSFFFWCCDEFQMMNLEKLRNEPFIFIGGYPRSGTTLMRVLLDVHPKVECGPETHILPQILYLYAFKIKGLSKLLTGANITQQLVDSMFLPAINILLHRNGPTTERRCAKDPFIDLTINQLLYLYPNAQFILMVRDGRAVANSVVSRKVKISRLDISNPQAVLKAWDDHYQGVLPVCLNSTRCHVVRYEDLVLRPREQMMAILEWLNVPWDDVVLQHDQYIDGVKLAKGERSTSQVVFPIYTEALTNWASPNSSIPASLIDQSQSYKMLCELGYAYLSIPPVYGIPEPEVEERAKRLAGNDEFKNIFRT